MRRKGHLMITLPATVPWELWLEEADAAATGGDLNYRIGPKRRPKLELLFDPCKVFLVHRGRVRGYHAGFRPRTDIRWRSGFICEVTGRAWEGGLYLVRSGPFVLLEEPPAMKGFRGWRYSEDLAPRRLRCCYCGESKPDDAVTIAWDEEAHCLECYPYGVVAEWSDEPGKNTGGPKEGARLHRIGCKLLRAIAQQHEGADYAWCITEKREGEELLRSGFLRGCGFCGTRELVAVGAGAGERGEAS